MSTATARRSRITRIAVVAAIALLAVLMVLNTRFLSADEAAAVNPAEFSAADYAAEEYPGIAEGIEAAAVPIESIAAQVIADPRGAGAELGNTAGTDKYAISVTATGTVAEAADGFLTLTVPGLPDGTVVRVAVGQAANGTALRDALGEIGFQDFRNQTDYQQVANELKALSLSEVSDGLDVAALAGTVVTVTGVFVTETGPAGSFLITPVLIEQAA